MSNTIATVDQLTPEWFTELLRRNDVLDATQSVVTATLAPFGEGESMMSSLYRASLTYGDGAEGPGSLVVKLASPNDEQRFVASMFKFYAREIRFYRELQSRARITAPRCYIAEMHENETDFVLVLDLATGRRQVDQLTGVGFDDAVIAVETLADLHASFWGQDLSDLADPYIPFDSPPLHAVIPDVFTNYWSIAREQLVDEWPAEVVALCDRFRDVAAQVLTGMNGPDTLCHGDFRSDNLLYGADGGLLVLDYQLGAIANGATDVAYFVSQSVDEGVAAAHADELLDRYIARLAEHGVTYSRDEALLPYQAGLVFYLQIPMSMLINPTTPDRGRALARIMLRRAAAEIVRTKAHERFV